MPSGFSPSPTPVPFPAAKSAFKSRFLDILSRVYDTGARFPRVKVGGGPQTAPFFSLNDAEPLPFQMYLSKSSEQKKCKCLFRKETQPWIVVGRSEDHTTLGSLSAAGICLPGERRPAQKNPINHKPFSGKIKPGLGHSGRGKREGGTVVSPKHRLAQTEERVGCNEGTQQPQRGGNQLILAGST